MSIAKNLSERKKSNTQKANVVVDMILTLNYNNKRLDIALTVDNRAESHRLRIMFPTNLKDAFSFGEGQFDVVKRSSERIDAKNWIEQPMYDYPMHNFVDVSNEVNGLSVLVDGLKEYELLDDKKKTLAVTLLRGFEYIIAPSSRQDYTHQKGSQSLGKSAYRFSLYPHSKSWIDANTYRETFNFNYEMKLVQSGFANGFLSAENSFFTIEPDSLIFSALKSSEDKAKDELVLRIFNPTEKTIDGRVKFFKKILSAEKTTLEEIFVERIEVEDGNSFKAKLEKKKIGTYKIRFGVA